MSARYSNRSYYNSSTNCKNTHKKDKKCKDKSKNKCKNKNKDQCKNKCKDRCKDCCKKMCKHLCNDECKETLCGTWSSLSPMLEARYNFGACSGPNKDATA